MLQADLILGGRAERIIAGFRVIGGLIGVGITLAEASLHPPVPYALEQAVYVGLIVVGAVSWVRTPKLDGDALRRWLIVTFFLDALLFLSIEPLNAWVTDVLSSPVGMLIPIIGGVKLGLAGAVLGSVGFALSQVVYEVVRVGIWGSPATISNSLAVVVIATLMGLLVGRVASDARYHRQVAEDRAAVATRALEAEVDVTRRFRELDRLRTDFLALAAHELRTPVTAVAGFAITLRDHEAQLTEAGDRHEVIRRLAAQAERLAAMVEDMQVVGELDRPAGPPVPVDVVAAVHAAVARVDEAGAVRVDVPEGLTVSAETDGVTEVLAQLITNAVRHGQEPIEVCARRDAGEVALTVRDTGPGIPPRVAEQAFAPFVVGGDVRYHRRGSGLGLAIVRALAVRMGGRVALTPGERAYVTVYLPEAAPVDVNQAPSLRPRVKAGPQG